MESSIYHVDNHNIAVIQNRGLDPCIVFLHGLGCSKRSFCHALEDARFLNYSFLMIDLPGFGESSVSSNFSGAMEDQATIVESLINQLAIDQVMIVAHSMGGAVGLLFSEEFYQRVRAFANLEGNLIGADCGLYSRNIVRMDFEVYKNMLFPKQLKDAADIPMLDLDQTTPHVMYASARSLVAWSDSNELLQKYKNLACRKAYFWGSENRQLEVLQYLGESVRIEIPNSGHGMMFDNPTGFQDALYQFLFQK